MLSFSRPKAVLYEIILLFVSAVVFLGIALAGNDMTVLLLLLGCIYALHYCLAAMFDSNETAIVPLLGLFCIYLLFCVVFRGWISLLLLPYLLNAHFEMNYRRHYTWLAIMLLPSVIFVLTRTIDAHTVATMAEPNIQHSWFGIVILTINSAISLIAKYAINRLLDETQNYRNAISLASINELSERAAKRELIIKQHMVERNARLEERERISLSIHNAVGHTMSAAILSLDAAATLYEIDPATAKEKLDAARACISQGLGFVRHAVRIIDNGDETMRSSDVASALVAHIDHFNSISKVKSSLSNTVTDDDSHIPRIHGEFIISTLLELLTNSSRGDATVCSVLYFANDAHIQLAVFDNGTSFSKLTEKERSDRLKNGFGLKNIEKHVVCFGGMFKLSCSDGFSVEITIPIKKE